MKQSVRLVLLAQADVAQCHQIAAVDIIALFDIVREYFDFWQ